VYSMAIAPIRTITFGIAEAHPLKSEVLERAAAALQNANIRYTEAGYDVQTVRLSTRPIFDDLADWSSSALLNYVQELQRILDDIGLSYCSLVQHRQHVPAFPWSALTWLPTCWPL